MIVFRSVFCGEKQFLICVILNMVFWYLYVILKLQEKEKAGATCSKCQIVGFRFSKDLSQEGVTDESDLKTDINQVDKVENGKSVLRQDHFVFRGLTELNSILKSTNNIFFVESSCAIGLGSRDTPRGEFTLDARQACGVESAARANPDRPVYILHSCPLAEDFALRVPQYSRALLELHNVYVVALDVAELFEGWPDPLPISSTSLGLLALWQFGGTYCDLDTLVLRSLQPLGTNYCGYRDDNLLVGDLVLNFEPLGYGHDVVTQLLNALSNGLDTGVWKEDVAFLTKVLDELCSQLPQSKEDCSNNLTMYDKTILFTVGLTDVQPLRSENFVNEFADRIKTTAFTMSYVSRLYSFSKDKDGPKYHFTFEKQFCPDVYRRVADHTS